MNATFRHFPYVVFSVQRRQYEIGFFLDVCPTQASDASRDVF